MIRRSALLVPIDLPPPIERLRYANVAEARLGVPAHVTVLFPFVDPPSVDERVLGEVAAAIGRSSSFGVTFSEVRRWASSVEAPQGVLWLMPEPDEPFLALTRTVFSAFPDHPPYEGRHDEMIPHLTLASDDASRFDAVEEETARHLPFERRADAITLFVEGFDGQWRQRGRFALAPAGSPDATARTGSS